MYLFSSVISILLIQKRNIFEEHNIYETNIPLIKWPLTDSSYFTIQSIEVKRTVASISIVVLPGNKTKSWLRTQSYNRIDFNQQTQHYKVQF